MKTATVGEIQKNFGKVIKDINLGEEITITKRGRPIAKLVALGPKQDITWPDFYSDAIVIKGKKVSQIVIESRGERF